MEACKTKFELQQKIYDACENRDLKTIKECFESKIQLDWNDFFYYACKYGDKSIINYLIESINTLDQNVCFYGACINGNLKKIQKNMDLVQTKPDIMYTGFINALVNKKLNVMKFIVNYIPKQQMNYNQLLQGACSSGKLDIVNYVIELLEDETQIEWTDSLYAACKGGNMDIIKLMMNKSKNLKIDWNKCLCGACQTEYEQTDITHFIIQKCTELNFTLDWRMIFKEACYCGDIYIVKLAIEKTTGYVSWNHGLSYACYGGHMDIIKLLIEGKNNDKSQSNISIDWTGGLLNICSSDEMYNYEKLEIIDLMIENGASVYSSFRYACDQGDVELMYILLEKTQNQHLLDSGLCHVAYSGNESIVNLLIELGSQDWKGGLIGACEGGHVKLAKLMINNFKPCSELEEALDFIIEHDVYSNSSILQLLIQNGGNVDLNEVGYYRKHIINDILLRTIEKQKVFLLCKLNDDLIYQIIKFL